MKNIKSVSHKKTKVIVPVFAANSTSKTAKFNNSKYIFENRDYVGNLEDLAGVLRFLSEICVTNIAELPFTQKHISTTSPFSSSLFGLELDYLVLEMIPEIQEDESLISTIPKRKTTYEHDLVCNFDIHREARKELLKRASKSFFNKVSKEPDSERILAFKSYIKQYEEQLKRNAFFSIVQTMILNTYTNAEPDFRTWPKEYQNPDNEAVKRLLKLYEDEVEVYQYSQFCLHEQQLKIKNLYKELNISREVNIAFGIDPSASGDVWAMQGKWFDIESNIGTIDGQNWHIPPYITKSESFYDLMKERVEYLAQYIDILFLDHLCGYATQFVLSGDSSNFGRYEIDIKERNKLIENVKKIIHIVLDAGLEVGGETLGDCERQSAVEEAISQMVKKGNPILEMHVAPHKNICGQYDDLRNLSVNTELFLSTHDLPTIIQMLCGRRGNVVLGDFIYPEHKIANFLSQQFGILTSPNQTPLNSKDITTDLGIAMLEIFMLSSAEMVTIPLQDIFAMLFPQEFGVEEYLNLNIAGTPSWVGNEHKNFSRILPPIENLEPFKEELKRIFSRNDLPFDYPERLIEHGNFFTWIANITPGRKLIYQNSLKSSWEIFHHKEKGKPIMELVISNLTMEKQIGSVELPEKFLSLVSKDKCYKLIDIASKANKDQAYIRSGNELLAHIYIELAPKTDHHFIVYEI